VTEAVGERSRGATVVDWAVALVEPAVPSAPAGVREVLAERPQARAVRGVGGPLATSERVEAREASVVRPQVRVVTREAALAARAAQVAIREAREGRG